MSQTPPTFPFAASTINATRPNTICLKTAGWHEEYLSSDSSSIYPGMLVTLQSDNSVKRHAVPGGLTEILIAKEDANQGHWILDAYASADLVPTHVAQRGDHMLVLVDASCAAFVEGAQLCSAGDGTFMPNPGTTGAQLYVNTASSGTVTNTTVETAFNKSYTIPANFLQAGDVLKIRAEALATATNSTDTLNIKLKIGSTIIAATGALDVANSNVGVIEATVVIRDIGATGHLVAEGITNIGTPGTATDRAFNVASTAIDTTVTEAVTVTATWSVADPGNIVDLEVLEIELERQTAPLVTALEAVDNSANASTMAYARVRVL